MLSSSFSLINLLFQAISAIKDQFPDSSIVKRLNVLSRPDAIFFFQQWPGLREHEETANSQISVLRNAFHETPTRNAFSSFAAQIHGMNQFMESTSENLSVLARRTESFSPSKHGLQFINCPPLNITPCSLFPPGRPTVPELETSTSNLSLPPGPPQTPASASPLSPEPQAQPLRQLEQDLTRVTLVNGGQVCPPTSSESGFALPVSAPSPASNILTPTMISAPNQCINHVLPLSPLDNPLRVIHTSHDLILPASSAFSSSTYPIFTTTECTWQYVLDNVVNPSFLWSSYAPGSLGEYADIKSIWQAWDEGAYIKDVGRKPALRLIDARWGNLESQETHKRKYPSWRPRNDNKVCFYFFYSQINLII